MTIFRKLLILILSLTLIPMLLVGVLSYYSAKKSLEYELTKKLESIADLKINKLESFFKERAGDAFIVSHSVFIKEYAQLFDSSNNADKKKLYEQGRAPLDNLFDLYKKGYGYRDIMLVNTTGVIIYTSNSSHFHFEFGRQIPDLFKEVFEKSRKDISFSDVYRERGSKEFFLMVVSTPVVNYQGKFIGEVFFEMDMKNVYDFLQDKTGLGKTGETLIGKKNKNGALFLSPLFHDPDAALKRIIKYDSHQGYPIIKAVQGQSGSGQTMDYHGDPVLAAWRPIPMMNWGFVAKMDLSEAFESVDSLGNQIIIILFFSMAVGSFLVFKITASVTEPIVHLTHTTQLVNSGDLTARAKVLSQDEIGELAKNFNAMVEKLTSLNVSFNEAQGIAQLGSWELNLSSNALTWSDEAYRIFELNSAEFGASYEAFLNAIHPDDREYVNDAYSTSLKNHTSYDIVHRLLMKDGRIKHVNEKCITTYDENGKAIRSIGTVHDITEYVQAEQKIIQLNAELENRVKERTSQLEISNKELEAFSYSVSHDLRAPLRSIIGFSELLKNHAYETLDEKSKHYLDVISESTIQMGRLIDDILSFSRMGRTEMMESAIDFSQLVKNAIKSLDNEINERKIIWNLNPLHNAKGDLSMMQLVFTNLISNAVKFTSKREQAEIEIGSQDNEKEIIYYVKDDGVGFDMAYSNKLFGLFQRLHRSDEFPGTGLGLANTHRIIQRHGGRIWAEGVPGKGATFYFSLPKK